MMECYICNISDADEIPCDPEIHNLCEICSAKVPQLARNRFELKLRDQIIHIGLKELIENVVKHWKVILSSGYEVDLEDEEGLEHLFHAIVGEVTARVSDSEEFSERGWRLVCGRCLCELHYVAGQLHRAGSSLDIQKLLDDFGVEWHRLAEKLSSDKDENDLDQSKDLAPHSE